MAKLQVKEIKYKLFPYSLKLGKDIYRSEINFDVAHMT